LAAWLGSHDFMSAISAFDALWQPVIIAALCALLTFAAAQMKDVPMPFEGAIRAIARLSYALYLVHYPLLPLAAVAGRNAFPAATFWLVYLTIAFVAAAMLHWTVEKPFLKMRDEISKDMRSSERLTAAYRT
jgi:peptidoglycan/LPS O-acetylase OafA/YrhL